MRYFTLPIYWGYFTQRIFFYTIDFFTLPMYLTTTDTSIYEATDHVVCVHWQIGGKDGEIDGFPTLSLTDSAMRRLKFY